MNRSGMMLVALGLSLGAFSASAAGLPAVARSEATAKAGEDWLTDFEQAKQTAAEAKRPILADFSGSDWCGWCIKLDKEVFSQPAFKTFAKDNVVLLLIDSPRKKEQPAELKKRNQDLSKTYAIDGFPTVLLLDSTGKELARTGYRKGGAEAYVVHLKELLKAKTPCREN